MKRYEKTPKKKIKLKKWQIITAICIAIPFIIATIILLILYGKAIFSEQTAVIAFGLLVIAIFIGSFFLLNYAKKE